MNSGDDRRSRSWQPTGRQALLLKAALAGPSDALDAWTRWNDDDVADAPIDAGSARLFPLVDENLRPHNVSEARLRAASEQRIQTWCDNQMLFHEAGTVVAAVSAAGVRTLVAKGAALALLYYNDPGLRPMSDVDLLVPRADADVAIDVMLRTGWTPEFDSPHALVPYQHSVGFSNGARGRCDLHWRLLGDGRQDVPDVDYWTAAVPLEIGGVSTLALCSADQLLHVCVHGALWNPTPSIRWVADAAWILRTAEDLDWRRLIRMAEQRRLLQPVGVTLRYLRDLLDAPIPDGVLQAITVNSRPVDRLVFACRSSARQSLRAIGRAHHWRQCWRECPGVPWEKMRVFTRYLQSALRIRHGWLMPFHVVSEAALAIYSDLTGTPRTAGGRTDATP